MSSFTSRSGRAEKGFGGSGPGTGRPPSSQERARAAPGPHTKTHIPRNAVSLNVRDVQFCRRSEAGVLLIQTLPDSYRSSGAGSGLLLHPVENPIQATGRSGLRKNEEGLAGHMDARQGVVILFVEGAFDSGLAPQAGGLELPRPPGRARSDGVGVVGIAGLIRMDHGKEAALTEVVLPFTE